MKTIERKARNLKVFYWKMFGYPGVSLAIDMASLEEYACESDCRGVQESMEE